MVLRAFAPAIRAELPFLMPTVAGTVRQGPLSTFVYSHLGGSTRTVEDLSEGSAALAREIGTAMAAIHDLPHSLVSNADLPSYTPNEFRQRRLNELDQAATTGKIPPVLLRRWEHALEDVSLWRFNPCVVHGDLHEDNLLVDGERVTAVTGWTDLRIGDPADDMAWLVASNEQDFVEAVLQHYTSSRRDAPDAHLLRRAALSAEFALAQYLVKGLSAGNQDMIGEAESMLTALAEDVAEHGGQPISVEPLPQPVHPPAPGKPAEAAGIPVPPVSKVTLLAPDSVSGLAAVPSSSAMPAVQVAPIPLDETSVAAAGSVAAASTGAAAVSEPGGGVPAVPAAAEGAAADGGPAGTAPADSGEADGEPAGTAPADSGEADGVTSPAPATAPAPAASGDAAAGTDGPEGQPVPAGPTVPGSADEPAEVVQAQTAIVAAADDTSTQSISVVAAPASEDISTTALPVVQAKAR